MELHGRSPLFYVRNTSDIQQDLPPSLSFEQKIMAEQLRAISSYSS